MVMDYTNEDSEQAIAMAIGAASVCWETTPTGVFDSSRAKEIADELTAHLRKLRLLPDAPRPKYGAAFLPVPTSVPVTPVRPRPHTPPQMVRGDSEARRPDHYPGRGGW